MKRAIGLVLALFGVLVAAAPPAVAAPSAKTISLVSVQVSSKQQGAILVTHDNDVSGKTTIGHDTLTCSATTRKCAVVFVFGSGNLNAQFAITGTSGSGTITGGTGSYGSASGSFTWKNLNSKGTRTAVVLHLA